MNYFYTLTRGRAALVVRLVTRTISVLNAYQFFSMLLRIEHTTRVVIMQ
jgi:hypothetical protein